MGMGKALCLFVCLGAVFSQPPTKPNIVVVMLDDVGYNDVGWNNPHIKTPNLDKMAREGVTLNNSYSQPVCSPSRAALLTGRYPHNVNMDGAATFGPTIPDGLDLKYWILPQKLKELGYTTHAIGKWHLGFCDWKYTPTERGFDTFFGFYLGANDYFSHRTIIGKDGFDGLDLRFNKTLVTDKDGVYDTNMWSDRAVEIIKNHDRNVPFFVYVAYNGIHGPLRAPEDAIAKYPKISDGNRRTVGAMMTVIDEGVANITKALTDSGIMDNTFFLFLSDNGGQYGSGNNYPLRGAKSTFFEGGMRTPAFVSGGLLKKKGYTHNGLFHIADWTPTILSLAGGDVTGENLDGIDMTKTVLEGANSSRDEIIHFLSQRNLPDSPPVRQQGVIRQGDWKLIEGHVGHDLDDWYQDPFDLEGQAGATRWRRGLGGKNKDKLNKTPKVPKVRTTRAPKPAKVTKVPGTTVDKVRPSGSREYVTYLFNIKDDPYERTDLSAQYPELVQRLQNRLRELHKTYPNLKKYQESELSNPDNWGGAWSPGWCTAENSVTEPVIG